MSLAPPTGEFGPPYTDHKMIVLCMTPRSGSSHLGSLMGSNGLGRGGEHFNTIGGTIRERLEAAGVKTYDEYIRLIVAERSQNNVFCVKTDWQQYMPVYYFGAHKHYFANASFLYLTRNDVLMQAISRYVATETRYFHSTNVSAAHTLDDDVPFNFDRISRHLQTLIDMQSAWEWFFASEGISPLRLSYEEVERDAKDVIRRIATHVDIPLNGEPREESLFSVVRNQRNEALREQFIERARKVRDEGGATLVRTLSEQLATEAKR